MAKQMQVYNIFIASPGDTSAEQGIIRATCTEMNRRPWLQNQGIQLEAASWEDAMPQAGDPRTIINQLAEKCDLLICLLHRQFDAVAGTLDLFRQGYEQWQQKGKPQIFLYFKTITALGLSDLRDPQVIRVMQFKEQVQSNRMALYKEFKDTQDFQAQFTRHLEEWISKPQSARVQTTDTGPVPPAGQQRVFMSHSTADKPQVEKIKALLVQERVPVWYDQDDMDIGDPLLEKIDRGIRESTFVAVFLSRAAAKSRWVQQEMRLAFGKVQDAEKKFLPVLLEDLTEDEIPGYLQGLLRADFRTQSEAQARQVVEQIKRAIHRFKQP